MRSVPRVGILIVRHIPRVGNLTWPPSWIMKKAWKSTLFPRLFPPQVVGKRPWERGCLKLTPPSWKIPRRRSNEIPIFVRGGRTRGESYIHCTLTVCSQEQSLKGIILATFTRPSVGAFDTFGQLCCHVGGEFDAFFQKMSKSPDQNHSVFVCPSAIDLQTNCHKIFSSHKNIPLLQHS